MQEKIITSGTRNLQVSGGLGNFAHDSAVRTPGLIARGFANLKAVKGMFSLARSNAMAMNMLSIAGTNEQ